MTISSNMGNGIQTALTIAGSDPGGGAGLQADLRAFGHLGVYGLSVVTAITAQNSEEVREFFPLDDKQVKAQLEAILDDMQPAATKTGMLATPEVARRVASMAAAKRLGFLVVDPVFASTSGASLAREGLREEVIRSLIPACDLVTPNIEEATNITGVQILTAEDAKEAALAMTEIQARAICVTGGHLRGDPVDILFDGRDFTEFPGERLGEPGDRFHGTGCLFSAGITGYLALGMDMIEAVRSSKKMVESAIRAAIAPGRGLKVPWIPSQSSPA